MHPHPAPDRLAAVDPKSGGMRMPCRSDGSQGSNDMDIESDDIKVSRLCDCPLGSSLNYTL